MLAGWLAGCQAAIIKAIVMKAQDSGAAILTPSFQQRNVGKRRTIRGKFMIVHSILILPEVCGLGSAKTGAKTVQTNATATVLGKIKKLVLFISVEMSR